MKKFNPQSKFSLSIKELITAALGLGSLLAYKDELIKNDFKNMREDISDIKNDINYIKDYIIKNKK